MNFFRVQIVFGSQTGTAHDVSTWISRKLESMGQNSSVVSGNELLEYLPIERNVLYIFVVATAGNGEPPVNFRKFWEKLFSDTQVELTNVPVAVFGLGDSKYTQFNYASRMLYGRLKSLGAKTVIPLGCGDDQHTLGYSQELIPWIDKLWETLFGCPIPREIRIPKQNRNKKQSLTQSNNACMVLGNIRITSDSHFQDVRKITFRLPQYWKYQPSDILAVTPRIPSSVAHEFITTILEENPDKMVEVSQNDTKSVSLDFLFTRVLDIMATPTHYFFEVLYTAFCRSSPGTDVSEEEYELVKEKLLQLASFTPEGANERLRYSARERLSVMEVLRDFQRHVKLNISELMDSIQKISPRYYSVCNSLVSKRRGGIACIFPYVDVEICVGIVDYVTLYGRHRVGLASQFLRDLKPGQILENTVQLERGFSSKLPEKISKASCILCVAPGTGIAPIRALRQSLSKCGTRILIMTSNRNPKTDFLFGDDNLPENVTQIIAWSRPDSMDRSLEYSYTLMESRGRVYGTGAEVGRKTWVQDLFEIFSNKIFEFLNLGPKPLVMICGRSHPMPQQVVEEIQKITGWTNEEMHRFIVYDTWG